MSQVQHQHRALHASRPLVTPRRSSTPPHVCMLPLRDRTYHNFTSPATHTHTHTPSAFLRVLSPPRQHPLCHLFFFRIASSLACLAVLPPHISLYRGFARDCSRVWWRTAETPAPLTLFDAQSRKKTPKAKQIRQRRKRKVGRSKHEVGRRG